MEQSSNTKTASQNPAQQPATAKPETMGNLNDPRWRAADQLEQDNEHKLGEEVEDKKDKTGGGRSA
jgi:hypothetical protein